MKKNNDLWPELLLLSTHIFKTTLKKVQLCKKKNCTIFNLYMPIISLFWQEMAFRLIDFDQCAKNQECLQKASTGIEVLCKCLVLILISCEKVLHETKKYYYCWGYKSILLCREFWPIWWQHYLGPCIPSCLSKEWIFFSNLSWVKISGCTVVEFKKGAGYQ